jgi:hypothetical protein
MPGIGPPSAATAAGIGPAAGIGSGPGGGIAPPAGPGAPARGPAAAAGSALPHWRQYFIPAGFSPRHTPHTMLGNPWAGT